MPKKKTADLQYTFQVVWTKIRDRFEVHGDGGQLDGFAREQQTAVAVAGREASQAERGGRSATICVERKAGSFKIEPNS